MNMRNETVEPSPRGAADRESADIKREGDAIREDLEHTLSAIERKFSPGELLDRSLDYVHQNGSDLLEKIGATVSKNPLPLLVTSAGLVWLLASSRSSKSPSRRTLRSSARRDGDFDPSAQSFASTDGAQGLKQKAQDAAQGLKQKAHQTLDAARSRASETWDVTREHAHQYSDNLSRFVSEQPLACGAIAVAAGAIIGASLPATRYERDLVTRARGTASTAHDPQLASALESNRTEPGTLHSSTIAH